MKHPNKSKINKDFVTIKTASEILGVSIETLRNWDKSGKLKPKRDKKNGYRLYSISKLEIFMEKNNLKKTGFQKVKLLLE